MTTSPVTTEVPTDTRSVSDPAPDGAAGPAVPPTTRRADPERRAGFRHLSAAQSVACCLREEILARGEDGWFLGSEDELLVRLHVSRPTLRQAARLLEQEQLLTVKRGLNGGLFARMPSAEGVAHMASVYLRSQHTSPADLVRSMSVVAAESAWLAATNPSPEARASLAEFVDDYQSRPWPDPRTWFYEVVRQFPRQIATLSGSPTLALFEDVLAELALMPSGLGVFTEPGRVERIYEYHRCLAAAVRDGDAEGARAIVRQQMEIGLGWLEECPVT